MAAERRTISGDFAASSSTAISRENRGVAPFGFFVASCANSTARFIQGRRISKRSSSVRHQRPNPQSPRGASPK